MKSRVLVPIDGRRSSTTAEQYAVELNEKMPLSVIILNVIDTKELDGHGIDPGLKESVMKTKRRFSEKAVAESVEFFKKAGVEYERRVLEGEPAKLICRTALEEESDMVIIAERSASDIKDWFIGGVTKKVLYQCQVPVLLIRHKS